MPKYAGSVTLIDRYEYFEMHVDTIPDELPELWQHARNAIFSGIEVVSDTLGYSDIKPRPAIVCPRTHTEKSHPAYLKGQHWICTSDNSHGKITVEILWQEKPGGPSTFASNFLFAMCHTSMVSLPTHCSFFLVSCTFCSVPADSPENASTSSGAVHPPTAPQTPLPPSSKTVYTMYLHSKLHVYTVLITNCLL